MKYIDLFAGVGGFRYGIERMCSKNQGQPKGVSTGNKKRQSNKQLNKSNQGFTCVYSNEWDKYANSVYKRHYGECDSRDIRSVKASEIPAFDLLCGGFPCQSFSIAGKRGGFSDTRGTLFFEIARIIKQRQPRLLLLENVKGLLSHDKGNTFATIIRTLDELGYDVQWQVLNSKDFGVPQNRERVFIVGHLRETPRPQVFPIRKDAKVFDREDKSNEGRTQTQLSTTLRGSNIKADNTFIVHNIYGGFKEGYREFRDVSPTIRTAKGGGHLPALYQDAKIRRLTPIECERLQGFPDNWTEYGADEEKISDTQRYKMMGNAVTTNVITEIVKKLTKN